MAAAAFRPPLSLTFSRRLPFSSKPPFPRTPIATSLSSSSSSDSHNNNTHQLVLYTKKGCCLCEGLKEKLDVAFSLAGTHSLDGVQLLTRDIEANPEWERLYQYEIPVLSRVLPDGTELVALVCPRSDCGHSCGVLSPVRIFHHFLYQLMMWRYVWWHVVAFQMSLSQIRLHMV